MRVWGLDKELRMVVLGSLLGKKREDHATIDMGRDEKALGIAAGVMVTDTRPYTQPVMAPWVEINPSKRSDGKLRMHWFPLALSNLQFVYLTLEYGFSFISTIFGMWRYGNGELGNNLQLPPLSLSNCACQKTRLHLQGSKTEMHVYSLRPAENLGAVSFLIYEGIIN